jgi:2-polyprenyl-6-hydroxyphenyl methylase/3-demethylubiquinone-9 3-methyltransferase
MPTDAPSTIDADEIAHFSRLSAEWWDLRGPVRKLHRFNKTRVGYIRERAAAHFGRDPARSDCLAGLRILDIGCGGGILSEPMAELGATVVGADPAPSNIAVAKAHAAQAKLSIDYRSATAEALADAGELFDVVLAMEVVEHVADVSLFLDRIVAMVKPNGLIFLATFNRTFKSFLLGIVAAEYILGWVPRGTHQWGKFVTPDELKVALARGGLRIVNETGVAYEPFSRRWRYSGDMAVNYMLFAERPRAG